MYHLSACSINLASERIVIEHYIHGWKLGLKWWFKVFGFVKSENFQSIVKSYKVSFWYLVKQQQTFYLIPACALHVFIRLPVI